MNDLISRQMAIKAIKEDKIDLTNPNVVAVFKATGDFEKVETQVMTCDRHIEILKDLPSAQPDKEKISDALYHIYRNKGTSTSAEGVAAIKYYIAEIWREIYGEEGPIWLKK